MAYKAVSGRSDARKKPEGHSLIERGAPKNRLSVKLFRELSVIGEPRLVKMLTVLREALGPMLDAGDSTRISAKAKKRATIAELEAHNIIRAEATREAVLAGALNSDAAGRIISKSRPIVNKLAKRGELVAIPVGRYLRFPRWQFDETTADGLVQNLKQTLAVMDASPYRKAVWFVTKNPRLGSRSPIELLREGNSAPVFEEAKGVTSG